MVRGAAFVEQFDAFSKPLKDFRLKTITGAIILKVDAMDVTGAQQLNVHDELYKTSLSLDGNILSESVRHDANVATSPVTKPANYCGPCYGADTPDRKCCNTCADVQEAYIDKGWNVVNSSSFEQCRSESASEALKKLGQEGCRIYGRLKVNKVAGAFHIAPGITYKGNHGHVHNLKSLAGFQINVSHSIEELRFGEYYFGQANSLRKTSFDIEKHSQMITYYLKLVPTVLLNSDREEVMVTNQYSATWHSTGTPLSGGGNGLPGLFFNYELAPLRVKILEEKNGKLD